MDNGVYNKLMGSSTENKGDTQKELDPFEANDEELYQNNRKNEFEESKEKGRLNSATYHKYVNSKTVAAEVNLLNSMVQQPFIIGKK